jgi:hypothetical protein
MSSNRHQRSLRESLLTARPMTRRCLKLLDVVFVGLYVDACLLRAFAGISLTDQCRWGGSLAV